MTAAIGGYSIESVGADVSTDSPKPTSQPETAKRETQHATDAEIFLNIFITISSIKISLISSKAEEIPRFQNNESVRQRRNCAAWRIQTAISARLWATFFPRSDTQFSEQVRQSEEIAPFGADILALVRKCQIFYKSTPKIIPMHYILKLQEKQNSILSLSLKNQNNGRK